MKKTILFFALTFGLNVVNGQSLPSGTVTMTKADPAHSPTNAAQPYICKGDTVVITFKFKFSGVADDAVQWQLFLTNPDNSVYLLNTFSYSEMLNFSRTIITPDTFYTIRVLIPEDVIIQNSDGSIIINFNGTYTTPGKNITVFKCLTTGITEYSGNVNTTIFYQDINGNIVTPHLGDFLIENKNGLRRKVLICE